MGHPRRVYMRGYANGVAYTYLYSTYTYTKKKNNAYSTRRNFREESSGALRLLRAAAYALPVRLKSAAEERDVIKFENTEQYTRNDPKGTGAECALLSRARRNCESV
jgi:hypothetical protein